MTDDTNRNTFLNSRKAAVVVAALVAIACLYIARKASVQFDDVYITLTYAKRLAGGEGMVFNPVERVQGTTSSSMNRSALRKSGFGCGAGVPGAANDVTVAGALMTHSKSAGSCSA